MDDAAFKKKLRQLDEAAYQETDRIIDSSLQSPNSLVLNFLDFITGGES